MDRCDCPNRSYLESYSVHIFFVCSLASTPTYTHTRRSFTFIIHIHKQTFTAFLRSNVNKQNSGETLNCNHIEGRIWEREEYVWLTLAPSIWLMIHENKMFHRGGCWCERSLLVAQQRRPGNSQSRSNWTGSTTNWGRGTHCVTRNEVSPFILVKQWKVPIKGVVKDKWRTTIWTGQPANSIPCSFKSTQMMMMVDAHSKQSSLDSF